MQHRQLNDQRLTLAVIDDVIARGKWDDSAELRDAVPADPALLDKVERICRAHIVDPYTRCRLFRSAYDSIFLAWS